MDGVNRNQFQRYVVGFLFSPDWNRVVLVRKNRPEWQAGFLNGVGGHIENGESPQVAISREFEEETGLSQLEWTWFHNLREDEVCTVDFFYGSSSVYQHIYTMTDEEIVIRDVLDLVVHDECLPNLKWLVPMARYAGTKKEYRITSFSRYEPLLDDHRVPERGI